MVVDHIVPASAGGETSSDNLCLSCVSCNSYKLNFQTGMDPESGEELRLYNPRRDRRDLHFAWSGDNRELIALTPLARATVSRLKMNQQRMRIARREWLKTGLHPPPKDT